MVNLAPIASSLDHQVHSCGPEQTLAEVADAMWKWGCTWLPVVKAQDVVVGVITETDVRLAILNRGSRLEECVAHVMTRFVVSVTAGSVIEDVEKLMQWSALRRFPVLDDDGRLMGVVTLTDAAPVENHPVENVPETLRSSELSERRAPMSSRIIVIPGSADPRDEPPIAA
jgi:CBS domain-containing protein